MKHISRFFFNVNICFDIIQQTIMVIMISVDTKVNVSNHVPLFRENKNENNQKGEAQEIR